MQFIIQLFQMIMTGLAGADLSKKQTEYETKVDAQIAEGRTILEARAHAAMNMIANDPDFTQARSIVRGLPAQAQQEMFRVGRVSEQNQRAFLSTYDQRTGQYLDEEKLSTAAFLRDLEDASRGISGGYAGLTGEYGARETDITGGYEKREADVLALLESQGNQALLDTQRTFGETTGAAMGDLVSRGLSGSGVGASVRGGLATQEAAQLARIREDVAAQRAGAMAGLRGDTLGWQERGTGDTLASRERGLEFGERAMTLGAGFRNEGIGRRLGARTGVEAGRASYDAAMRGSTQDRRAAAWDRVYGAHVNRANWLTGQGQGRLETWLGTQGDLASYLGGGPVQYVPPDTSWWPQMAYSGGSAGRDMFG